MTDDEKKAYNEETDKKVTATLCKIQASHAVARIRQFTGKSYPKLEADLTKLSAEALMELNRFVSDAQSEVQRAKNQAIHQPWRR